MQRTPQEQNERAVFWQKVGAAYALGAVALVILVVLS